MACLMVVATGAQAQKKDVLKANDLTLGNGESADLVISMDYETSESISGANFSLYLPDGILLNGFDTKADQDAAKASALKKACDLGEDGVWGEDAASGWLSVKQKADGGLLFVLIDQDDKTPFVSTKATVVTVKLHAVADVQNGVGSIKGIGVSNTEDKSLDLGNINDVTFAVNGGSSEGINEINANAAAGKVYNIGGQQVVAPTKGLYIQNGKKVIVK
jgi:hypothetical protein